MPHEATQPRTLTTTEVLSQPTAWRTAAAVAAELDIPHGAAVAGVGCGTSYYVLNAWAALREGAGLGRTDTWIASQYQPRDERIVVALSRSGTTHDVAAALGSVPTGRDRLAIVGVVDSPIARAATAVADLSAVDEQSVVQTRFATSSLALLRACLGTNIEPLAESAEYVLAGPAPDLDPATGHVVFLGHGWAVNLAHEAALKLREGAEVFTESYLAEEYLHGPIALARPGTVVWALGGLNPTIADSVRATGARLVTSARDPQVELVAIHRFMLALAAERGLDCDRPRNLSRSVTAATSSR